MGRFVSITRSHESHFIFMCSPPPPFSRFCLSVMSPATARDDGELDRWNAGGGGGGEADPDQIEEDNTMAEATPVDNPASDEIHEGPEELGGNMQRFGGGSKIVVASSTARGRRSARGEPFSERPSERFRSVSGNAAASNRGGARGGVGLGSFASPSGSNSRRAGGVAVRGSLASRLGPVVGRPVVVVGVDKPAIGMGRGRRDKKEGRGGDEGRGEEGELVPGSDVSGVVVVPQPPPMVEPSKPELHAAYKDGDTKKRNRR